MVHAFPNVYGMSELVREALTIGYDRRTCDIVLFPEELDPQMVGEDEAVQSS